MLKRCVEASCLSLAIILVGSVFLGVVLGVLIERGLLKFLYNRDEHIVVLATFAGFLVLEDVILLIWERILILHSGHWNSWAAAHYRSDIR